MILISISDLIGRKYAVYLGNTLLICGLIIVQFVDDLPTKLLGFSMCFGAESSYSGLFTMILSEFSCNKNVKQ